MDKFFKLNKKELEKSLLPEAKESIKRSIVRKRMDLEDIVAKAKAHVNKICTITSLEDFDAANWVNMRNSALIDLAIAEAELEQFNKNFRDENMA